MTDDQRLKWALWFSRVDLSRQRPKDVERLREELQRFCLERELPFAEADSSFLPLPSAGNAGTASGRTRKIRKEMVGRPGTTPLVAPLPLDYTIADFRHLQEKVQTLLNGLVAAHDVGAQVGSATPLPGFTLAGHFTIGPMVLGSYNYVSITGRTEDMALLALLFSVGPPENRQAHALPGMPILLRPCAQAAVLLAAVCDARQSARAAEDARG